MRRGLQKENLNAKADVQMKEMRSEMELMIEEVSDRADARVNVLEEALRSRKSQKEQLRQLEETVRLQEEEMSQQDDLAKKKFELSRQLQECSAQLALVSKQKEQLSDALEHLQVAGCCLLLPV